ncbi:conserved hypothetical protein [Methanococcus vannielii SB]|uniref:Uncharacterized protein n=1 Tax=Methanococcus vannielii (strain ATCC 35089 / DSM 1224 / JCM 13029 / OCM 148 / SB) TaxID=406327 RepID=A6UQI6_METVS|nr:DUF3343 domain-containing protein [Methanococcus vannielii]ABR54758.1 conserved hypothetical protein [Methanococcus vannielii SB]
MSSFFNKLKSVLEPKKEFKVGKGLIIFKSVRDAMKAEKILKNYSAKVVAPPHEIREGCDLAVEYEVLEETGIKRELKKNKLVPLKFISLDGQLMEPLDIVKVKEIQGFTMVRSGNMKITIDGTGKIVNISGGGCPDVPYLNLQLIGRNILEINENETPKALGYTLCAYTLNKAFEEAKKIFSGE